MDSRLSRRVELREKKVKIIYYNYNGILYITIVITK